MKQGITLNIAQPVADALLILAAAAVALVLANSAAGPALHEFWTNAFSFGRGLFHVTLSAETLVNDVLMALFFLVVGAEVKEEIIDGELASLRKAALPLVAALGGMVVPIVLYLLVNASSGALALRGWGIPMATDIVFATLVLDLAGKRVPPALKVFLTALAVADDLGAMLVIMFIGGNNVQPVWVVVALVATAVLVVLALKRVQNLAAYLAIGTGLVVSCYLAGIHPTVAGVVVAFALPARGRQPRPEKIHADAPLVRATKLFGSVTSYGVLPLFAFANAGIVIDAGSLQALLTNPASLGVSLGLLIGKPLGVWGFSVLAVKTKLAHLPESLDFRQLFAAALLAGIGFTMSIFIAHLSFEGSPDLLSYAKLAVITASLIMGLTGYLYIRTLNHKANPRKPC
jgi:NhaA family Na+:H+ antiporter